METQIVTDLKGKFRAQSHLEFATTSQFMGTDEPFPEGSTGGPVTLLVRENYLIPSCICYRKTPLHQPALGDRIMRILGCSPYALDSLPDARKDAVQGSSF
jgi:hypothetical protein